MCVVLPRRSVKEEYEDCDCVEVLVKELKNVGFIVGRALGLTAEFIRLAAPLETIGMAATQMQMKKLTCIGMGLQFEWEEVKAFVRQPDGSLFSWCERFECYHHLLYGIIAIYFAFFRMYMRWMLFPAVCGLIVQLVDFGSLQFLVLPSFFISIIIWAGLFFQFWKYGDTFFSSSASTGKGNKFLGMEWSSLQPSLDLLKNFGIDKMKKEETLGILCGLEIILLLSFGLTAVYLVLIQYLTKIGDKISMKLIKYENNENIEYQADSLVYKVFGLYFMQSYIGVFYHALLHQNFMTLCQVLVQRLLVYQVLEILLENSLPYLKYSCKKYRAVRNKKQQEDEPSNGKVQFNCMVEKEYLKPTYSASIGEEVEDGLFDDFLQLTLQFGMFMTFACAFPLAFALAAVNSFTKLRTDGLKLLSMLKRPVPRAATTIGAWVNIFQLTVMSICTNSVLLICLYDQEGKWKIEPGLAAILILEHALMLLKFGFCFLPEKPAWVRANRVKNATKVQGIYILNNF